MTGDDDELRLTCRELMSYGFCMAGQKTWFEANGFNFRDVLKNGVTESELMKFEDGYVHKALAKAKEHRNERG